MAQDKSTYAAWITNAMSSQTRYAIIALNRCLEGSFVNVLMRVAVESNSTEALPSQSVRSRTVVGALAKAPPCPRHGVQVGT